MSDDAEKLARLHDWLFAEHIAGKPTRAAQIDEVLSGVRAGKMTARALLWLSGFLGAMSAAYLTIRGGFK